MEALVAILAEQGRNEPRGTGQEGGRQAMGSRPVRLRARQPVAGGRVVRSGHAG